MQIIIPSLAEDDSNSAVKLLKGECSLSQNQTFTINIEAFHKHSFSTVCFIKTEIEMKDKL